MSRYEGLFIFPETLKDDGLERAINDVKTEVGKLGGTVENAARMGRKLFSRPINKQSGGHYVVFNLEIDGSKIKELQKCFSLNDDIVRVQYVRQDAAAPLPAPDSEEEETAEEEKANAVG